MAYGVFCSLILLTFSLNPPEHMTGTGTSHTLHLWSVSDGAQFWGDENRCHAEAYVLCLALGLQRTTPWASGVGWVHGDLRARSPATGPYLSAAREALVIVRVHLEQSWTAPWGYLPAPESDHDE